MLALGAILTVPSASAGDPYFAHELGHYNSCAYVRRKVFSTLPFLSPHNLDGTWGAFIRPSIHPSAAAQIFLIFGIAGRLPAL